MLPGLERLHLPIPLGGTSNHFRTEDLKSVLAWDAFNVTEDADLGMRLSRLGRRAETLNSITREEANCHTANWIHQRSRWLKGYLQTYLVHMRNPHKLLRELGLAGFLTFQLLIGAAMPAAFFHAVFWGLLAAGAAGWSFLPQTSAAASGLWAWSMALGLGGNGLAIVSGLIAAHRLGRQPAMNNGKDRLLLYLSALTMPVYWFLTSIAALKAIVSFVGRPFYWAKTRHGLSRF